MGSFRMLMRCFCMSLGVVVLTIRMSMRGLIMVVGRRSVMTSCRVMVLV